MRKLLVCLGLLAVLAQPALAFRPANWVYFNWPWAFDAGTGDWHWFKTNDTQWVNGFTAGGWRKMPASALASGWSFYTCPFAYCPANGSWYYINEPDTQWVVNMRTGVWSRFGTPAGMVLIPGGTNAGTDPDSGAYLLTLTPFYMDKYEVTKAKWDEVRAWGLTHGYADLPVGGGKGANHPVHSVNWYSVVKWCNARSEMEGRTPAYRERFTISGRPPVYSTYRTGEVDIEASWLDAAATGYRLPTAVQWEYAARGGLSGTRFPWGDTIQHSQANYYSDANDSYDISPTRGTHPTYATGGYPYTSPVGAFAANGYNVCDMAGNVWEWCFDVWGIGSARLIKGSSWYNSANGCRAGSSSNRATADSDSIIGFRAVLPPAQ